MAFYEVLKKEQGRIVKKEKKIYEKKNIKKYITKKNLMYEILYFKSISVKCVSCIMTGFQKKMCLTYVRTK